MKDRLHIMLFKDLDIGDVFNTKSGRWVKISEKEFMCIMNNGINNLGEIKTIDAMHDDFSIVPLYVSNFWKNVEIHD